jgi:hypothetical protein
VERLFPSERFFYKCEVPFGLKRIDLVFKERTNPHCVTAVELKLRNWKQAIWQAFQNRQVADYSYVALPHGIDSLIDLRTLTKLGLGVIVADRKEARIVVPAVESPFLNPRIAGQLSKYLEHA